MNPHKFSGFVNSLNIALFTEGGISHLAAVKKKWTLLSASCL
jgi:hypothetical protein